MQTISLRLPEELLDRLDGAAKARRVSKSSVVRASLETALREQPPAGGPSCYTLARDLAGSVRGLPADLATNPKYLAKFGQ